MGVHISVVRVGSVEEHPRWDNLRYAGDRDLAELLRRLPRTFAPGDHDEMFRPADGHWDDWDAAAAAWAREHSGANPSRFQDLLACLREGPSWYIAISY